MTLAFWGRSLSAQTAAAHIFVSSTLIVLFLAGCGQDRGARFLGTWRCPGGTFPHITIARSGEVYIVTDHDRYGDSRMSFTLDNGILRGSGKIGDITYDDANGHLYFMFGECTRQP